MKKLETAEKYINAPDISFYAGYIVTGDEELELCDDTETYEDGEVRVKQTIVKGVLTTELYLKRKLESGKIEEIEEKSTLVTKLKPGTTLIYVEGNGFIVPNTKVQTIDEAIEDLKLIK